MVGIEINPLSITRPIRRPVICIRKGKQPTRAAVRYLEHVNVIVMLRLKFKGNAMSVW